VPDTMAGKSVRCKQCATVFPLLAGAAPKPAAPAAGPFAFDQPGAMIQGQSRPVAANPPQGQAKRPSKADHLNPSGTPGAPAEAKSFSALPIILGLCGGAFLLLLVCSGVGVGGYFYVANKAKKAAAELRDVDIALQDLAKEMEKAAEAQPPAVSDTKPPAGDK